jgi:ATP-dependent DNA helicase RecG
MNFLTSLEKANIDKRYISKLEKLGIGNVKELLFHFPFRYEDYSNFKNISQLEIGENATISGIVGKIKSRKAWTRRNLIITEGEIMDKTGIVRAIWFGIYNARNLKQGDKINISGKAIEDKKGILFSNPNYEKIFDGYNKRETGGLIPIYPETKGLTSKGLRFLIKKILRFVEFPKDIIPDEILKRLKFPGIKEAINNIHFPKKKEDVKLARFFLSFKDIFLLEIFNIQEREKKKNEISNRMKIQKELLKKFANRLDFKLTNSQKQSIFEILKDLEKPYPMNRILQGDVGSGKTIVCAMASLAVANNNHQVAIMAPTEILARQHFKTFSEIFRNFDFCIGLSVSSENKIYYGNSEVKISKKDFLEKTKTGELDIVIGTHTLIQKNLEFKNLSLSVIDEQHRFGVKQRLSILEKSSNSKKFKIPHSLMMTATPIPRTLALTIWGNLDISTITEKPLGRKDVITKLIDSKNRQKAYRFIKKEIQKGRQCFVICPLIDISEKIKTKNATEEYEKLQNKIFPDLRIGLLHGKLKTEEKEKILNDFRNKKIDILVSTSVIEVGIDIPNATLMIIEGAERFGLAQIYQFRGRIGRGEDQSYCFLFTERATKTAKERIETISNSKNIFELAEKDLKIRGPGEFLGEKQSGIPDYLMEALKDISIVKLAKREAGGLLKKDFQLKKYPLLKRELDNLEFRVN